MDNLWCAGGEFLSVDEGLHALLDRTSTTGEQALSTGHIDARRDPQRQKARDQFDRLNPWSECGDCAFIPVCAGGCVVASHTTLGDMNKPTCHKRALESAVISLAHEAAGVA